MNVYNKIKHNFLKANKYSENASVQDKVRKILLTQTHKYSKLINYHQVDNILNIGIRNFSEPLELSSIFKPSKIDALDIAIPKKTSADLKLIKSRNIKSLKLNFDKDLGQIDNGYDLIFSNMSFQWSQSLESLVNNLYEKLNKRSILAFSTLLNNNFYEISNILRVNKMQNSSTILNTINQAKLKCLDKQDFYISLTFNSFKDLVNHLKSTGINTYTGHKNKRSHSDIKNLYTQRQFKLSYHIGLFICFKE